MPYGNQVIGEKTNPVNTICPYVPTFLSQTPVTSFPKGIDFQSRKKAPDAERLHVLRNRALFLQHERGNSTRVVTSTGYLSKRRVSPINSSSLKFKLCIAQHLDRKYIQFYDGSTGPCSYALRTGSIPGNTNEDKPFLTSSKRETCRHSAYKKRTVSIAGC